jgi:hypothetical protein
LEAQVASGVLPAEAGLMRTEDLIGQLAAELRPVRPMLPPLAQAALWLCGAVLAIAIAVLLHGPRPDLLERFLLPQDGLQWLAVIGTGITAAIAAAMLARPDRSLRWALLPLPFLLAWVATLGLGCLEDLARLGDDAMDPHVSWTCIRFITLLGMPLGAGLLLLLRHAGPVRPTPVLGLAGLASAALCSAGLTLFHRLDAALEVLISHGAAITMVAAIGRFCGRGLLVRPAAGPG